MGNINRIGAGAQFNSTQNNTRKEVKGSASSTETQASTKAASSLAVQQNAEAFRKLLVEKFGKEIGNDMADALDDIKKSGKYLTFENVKNTMEAILEKHKASSSEFQKVKDIYSLFPHDIQTVGKPDDNYDPFGSAKVIAATRQEMLKQTTKTQKSVEAEDIKTREQQKVDEQKKAVEKITDKKHKKGILMPKNRV